MRMRLLLVGLVLSAAGPAPVPPSRDTQRVAPGPYGDGRSLYEYFFGDPRRPNFDPQLRCWYRCPAAQQRKPK